MARIQSRSSGSSAAYGVPAGNRPAGSASDPRTRRCIARTRRVSRSASSRVPHPIALSTMAVRFNRSYGSSSAPVCAKKPAQATGCAACMSRVRPPASTITRSRTTLRSIDSSVK